MNKNKKILKLIIIIIFSLSFNPLLWLIALLFNIFDYLGRKMNFLVTKLICIVIGIIFIIPNTIGMKSSNSELMSIITIAKIIYHEEDDIFNYFQENITGEIHINEILRDNGIINYSYLNKYDFYVDIVDNKIEKVTIKNIKGIFYIYELNRIKELHYYPKYNYTIVKLYRKNKSIKCESITRVYTWYERIIELSFYGLIKTKHIVDIIENHVWE